MSTTRNAIETMIRAHQPALTSRLRGPMITALASRLTSAGSDAGLTNLVLAIPRVVGALRDEHAATQRRLAAIEAEVHAEISPAGQQIALARAIRREVRDRRRRHGDLRALRRDFDLAALRERFAGELDDQETQVELAIGFLGSAATAVASDPPLAPPLRRADLPAFLLPYLTWRARFTMRLATTVALQQLCDALGSADQDGAIAAAMTARVRDPDEHPWVQAAALGVLTAVAPADGMRTCAEILRAPHTDDPDAAASRTSALMDLPPEMASTSWFDMDVLANSTVGMVGAGARINIETQASPAASDVWACETDAAMSIEVPIVVEVPPTRARDFTGRRAFLLRRLVIDWLVTQLDGSRGPAATDLITEAAVAGDPSEHVRTGLCRAAIALPVGDVRGAAMLTALADAMRESSPVVRCWALQASADTPIAEALLHRSLSDETSSLVLRIACTAAVQCVAAGQSTGILVRTLTTLAARDDRPAAVHEAAAAALEAIDRATDPARAAWTARLARALATTPPGRSTTITVRDLPSPDQGGNRAKWLGRILADLTHDDWGVDADMRGGRVTLRRGDRWRPRLWRLLHELRTPSPNKRQAHSHTRGRVLRGSVRAHSGRLHEVTSTGVPGERVHIDREGGWGRHLPLVDDLLGLPWLAPRPRPVQVFSSHGVCTISWRSSLGARLLARTRIMTRYAWLSALRSESLAAGELAQRGRYVATLRAQFGIDLEFTPHPKPRMALGTGELISVEATPPERSSAAPELHNARPLPEQLRALFPADDLAAMSLPAGEAQPTGFASLLLAPGLLDWLRLHAPYFISVSANSQQALAYFLAGLVAFGLIAAYLKNRRMARDRAAIPLVIGGWGTRGKSGTERLKAGLLHGLGYRVFSKTTGCEAMFIHAPPLGPAREIYSFRPYGKATIWEQHTLLNLAARMHSQVFLWECMALSPAYVQILQHSWMKDDLSTITNAYPDHEDIQGPAGIDVATVISGFVPTRGNLVTSEINFLPLMRAAAERRGTRISALGDLDGELLPADLLALFPYEEHPRNIALVARMAVELGLDPTLAIVTMAEHVVPDLGVLKRFGPARLRGRLLEFINGCSANERTGFVSNWRRTGCDRLDLAAEPDRYVITVVNNRDDRVSRSQVFARVMVEDVAVDRHVIIGTNTQGLLGYVRDSLHDFLLRQTIVGPDDLTLGTEGTRLASTRLEALLQRLRPVPATPAALAQQLGIFASGAARSLTSETLDEAATACARWLAPDASAPVSLATVLAEVQSALGAWTESAVDAAPQASLTDPPEVDAPATAAVVAAHFVRQVARTAIACRLRARLATTITAGPGAIEGFHGELRAAYSELFMELVDVVDDPLSTGDQTVLRCALAVPPGVRVAIMGTQNIKGTGLDFVYRWIALDTASQNLAALQSGDPAVRRAALQRLENPDDPGLLDAGLVAARLRTRAAAREEAELQTRAEVRAEATHQARRAALGARARKRGKAEAFFAWLELWVDFIDGARRHARARVVMRDLIDQRISHARAAQAMRELDARAKGGWLVKAMRHKQ